MRKVLVIGTGGTISCAAGENGLAPALSVSELLKRIDVPCEIHSEQLFELDSTNMTPRHWETLARLIRERYDEFDGFVITHGTDTMAYAAASLSCLIQNSRKPIVFTGSMMPMTMEHSDAPENLCRAIAVAADKRAFGVRVMFGSWLYNGQTVTKFCTDDTEAFNDMNAEDEICFKDIPKYGFENAGVTGETRFYEHLSDDVFHVKLIPGQKLYVPKEAKAVIMESYGTGGVPDYLREEVKALAERGVYVIIATQCAIGGTDINRYAVGRADIPLLETGKMSVEYAVARARWALAYSDDFEGFKKLFYGEG